MKMYSQVLHGSSLRWHYPGQVQRVEGPLPLLSVRHAGPNSPLEFLRLLDYGVPVRFVNNGPRQNVRHPFRSVTQIA